MREKIAKAISSTILTVNIVLLLMLLVKGILWMVK